MNSETFNRIMSEYNAAMQQRLNVNTITFESFKNGYDSMRTSTFGEPDSWLWMASFGRDINGHPIPNATPLSQYDAFMAGFINSNFRLFPWSDNVRIDEFWSTNGRCEMGETDMLAPSEVAREFRFTANGFLNGIPGPIPSKKFNGWKFQLDTLYCDSYLKGTLYVQYKRDNEYFPLICSTSIQRCRLALVTFLEIAWSA